MRTSSIDAASIARFLTPRGQSASVRQAAEALSTAGNAPTIAGAASPLGRAERTLGGVAPQPRSAESASLLSRLAQHARAEFAPTRSVDASSRTDVSVQVPTSPEPAPGTQQAAPAEAEPVASASGLIYNDQAIAALSAAFGTKAGQQGYNPSVDTDANGTIDFLDLNYMLANYQPDPQ